MSINQRIDLRHLRAFVAVAEDLNFRHAAERLGIAQPAISRTIADLEHHLSVRLMERTTRSVSLTEAGQAFLGEARTLLAQLDRATLMTRNIGQGAQGRLTVAYMEFAIHDLVPPILRAFRDSFPEIQVDLVYYWSELQRELLVEQRIDIGFMIGPFDSPNTESWDIKRDRLTVVLPTDHPLAAQAVIHPQDLSRLPLILGDRAAWGAFRRVLDRVFRRARVIPQVAQEASTMVAVLGMVRAELGVSLFAGEVMRYDMSGLTVRPLVTQGEALEVQLVWNTTRKKALVQNFVHLTQALAPGLLAGMAQPSGAEKPAPA